MTAVCFWFCTERSGNISGSFRIALSAELPDQDFNCKSWRTLMHRWIFLDLSGFCLQWTIWYRLNWRSWNRLQDLAGPPPHSMRTWFKFERNLWDDPFGFDDRTQIHRLYRKSWNISQDFSGSFHRLDRFNEDVAGYAKSRSDILQDFYTDFDVANIPGLF